MDFIKSFLPILEYITSSSGQVIYFILLISLTIIVASIRIYLRIDLGSLGKKAANLIKSNNKIENISTSFNHPIINEVVIRCNSYKTRSNLGKIDFNIIIDQAYSRNKLQILILFARRDSWDFVCRSFPNILISLGLLGTFVGITYNLIRIKDVFETVLKSSTSEQIILILQEPLKGIATAFISSLFALSCGIILTVVNLIFNTTVAKYRFLCLLEDYLNNAIDFNDNSTNVLLSGIKDSLMSFRSEIVESLTTTIAQAIGQSFASQVALIITENQRATQNLSESANRFMESSATISNSAESFKYAAEFFSKSDFSNSISNFSNTIEKASLIFEQTSQVIVDSSNQFNESIDRMDTYTQNFVDLHTELSQLLTITQTNQENLLTAMPIIQQERKALLGAVQLIKNLQINIETSAKNLDKKSQDSIQIQGELNKLIRVIGNLTQKVTNKLNEGLNFDGLHKDNQKIIELLGSIQSDSKNVGLNNEISQLPSSETDQQINQLVLIANNISTQLADQVYTSKDESSQLNYSLVEITDNLKEVIHTLSLKISPTGDSNAHNNPSSLQVEGVSRLEFQMSNLSKLIDNINKQVINVSNCIHQDNKTALFPTIRQIMSKKIISNK